MLSRRLAVARPLSWTTASSRTAARTPLRQLRAASISASQQPSAQLGPPGSGPIDVGDEELDPRMNGDYPNPPPVKRSLRDPYDDWWDKQERRNYGEPVHEDNDILGVFSTEAYTHFSPGWGAVMLGTFVASVFGLAAVVGQFYPDKPSVPKTYEGGLEAELGGPGALRARKDGEGKW